MAIKSSENIASPASVNNGQVHEVDHEQPIDDPKKYDYDRLLEFYEEEEQLRAEKAPSPDETDPLTSPSESNIVPFKSHSAAKKKSLPTASPENTLGSTTPAKSVKQKQEGDVLPKHKNIKFGEFAEKVKAVTSISELYEYLKTLDELENALQAQFREVLEIEDQEVKIGTRNLHAIKQDKFGKDVEYSYVQLRWQEKGNPRTKALEPKKTPRSK